MRIAVTDIDALDLEGCLEQAAVRLRAIYDAQAIGRDLTLADQEEQEIAAVVNPERAGRRQGFGLPAAAKTAVEARAMALATAWLDAEGYRVKDHSQTKPYDLEATLGDTVLKVEVKGTTSDRADAILMTRNEVLLHQSEQGSTALIVVSKIGLGLENGVYRADGGVVEALVGWNINDWVSEPTAFRLTRREDVAEVGPRRRRPERTSQ
jgi:hypothetical protein